MTRTSRLVGVLLVAGVVAGCGSADEDRSAELRQYLADHHKSDHGFDSLGVVTFSDGDVTVNGDAADWNSPDYGAYLSCEWVSEWLYKSDAGGADSRVIVVLDGETVLTREGESEDCAAASFRSGGL